MNIYEKMSAITAEITAVAKNLNVGWGKNQYKAVGEADVLAAVKPIEEKHKVYSYPFKRSIIESGILTSTKSDGSETRQQFMRLETVYRFVDMEKPESFIDITTYGDGVDSQDKAPGKAMTYADKYALLKAYKIITGDDPDQDYSKDLKKKESKKTAAPAINKESTISKQKLTALKKLLEEKGIRPEFVCSSWKIEKLEDMTEAKHASTVKNIDVFLEKQNAFDAEKEEKEKK